MKSVDLTFPRRMALPLLALVITLAGCGSEKVVDLASTNAEKNDTAPMASFTPNTTATRDGAAFATRTTSIRKAPGAEITAPKAKYNAGEDPDFARQHGWPVKSPQPLP